MAEQNNINFGHILCAVQQKNNMWMYASVSLHCCSKGVIELRLNSFKTKLMEANRQSLASTPLNNNFFNDFQSYLSNSNVPMSSIGQTLSYILKTSESSTVLSNKPYELQIIENNENERRILLVLPFYGTNIIFCGNDEKLSPIYSTLFNILNANNNNNEKTSSMNNFNWCWSGFSFRDSVTNMNAFKPKLTWKNSMKTNLNKSINNNDLKNSLSKNNTRLNDSNNKLNSYLDSIKENIPPQYHINLTNDYNINSRKRYSTSSEYSTEMEIEEEDEKPLKRISLKKDKNFVLPSSIYNAPQQQSLLFSDLLSPLPLSNNKSPIITTHEASDDSFDYQLENIFNVSISDYSCRNSVKNGIDCLDNAQNLVQNIDNFQNDKVRHQSYGDDDDFFIRFTRNNCEFESPNRSFNSETIEEEISSLLENNNINIDTSLIVNEEFFNETKKSNYYYDNKKFNKELNLIELEYLQDKKYDYFNNFDANSSFMVIDDEDQFKNLSISSQNENNRNKYHDYNDEELSLAYFQERNKQLKSLFGDDDLY